MKNDIFADVVYKELDASEKAHFQRMMAKATLAIESLAEMPDMVWENRDLYRSYIIGNQVTGLTNHELAVCKSINIEEKNAICEVEQFKMRLLTGCIKFLTKYVLKQITIAKCFTQESSSYHIKHDLTSEAQTAFFHAVYRFNRYDIQFITFLGTVLKNWLYNYCQQLSIIKLSEKLKDDLIAYHSIRVKKLKADSELKFEEIIRIMVLNELRDQEIDDTESNVEEYIEQHHERFFELRQAVGGVVQVDANLSSLVSDVETEVMLNDIMSRMTEVQRKIMIHKINGGGLQKFADLHNMNKKQVESEFQLIRELIGSSLMA